MTNSATAEPVSLWNRTQNPVTRSMACWNTALRAGPARPQMMMTRPAVMRVMSTQPGTSPRSSENEGSRFMRTILVGSPRLNHRLSTIGSYSFALRAVTQLDDQSFHTLRYRR